jgi:hypothetical protein
MARRRRTVDSKADSGTDAVVETSNGGENMSETAQENLFTEPMTAEEWSSEGGGGSAARGQYTKVLTFIRDSGKRYHRIPLDRGPFAGKKSASVGTALKNAQRAKNAPEGIGEDVIKVTARSANEEKGVTGAIYVENTAVEDGASE